MLRKHLVEFVVRTLVQPFLLCFVFLYVFPKIGQGIGGVERSRRRIRLRHRPRTRGGGLSIMFQGIQAVAMQLAQEFGFTREIEDRVQAPCPIWLVAISKVISGGVAGAHLGGHRPPHRLGRPCRRRRGPHQPALAAHRHHRAAVVPRHDLARLLLGTSSSPATSASCSGSSCCPSPSSAAPTTSGPAWRRSRPVVHWLQTLVLVNPLIYVNEGMRAAFTNAAHMHLYVVYPALLAFSAVFLTLGLHNFRRKVLS